MKLNSQFFLEGSNGKAVLLIHGITAGALQMRPMAEFLNDYGYSVYGVNLAGHGTYPGDMFHVGCREIIDKAEYDYLQLKKEYDRIIVGGHSTGGCLSLFLAAKYPEIAGIVPMSTPLSLVEGSFISAKYPPEQLYYHRSLEGKTGIAVKYHTHYEDIPVHIFKALYDLMDVLHDENILPQVKCPAYIVQAKNDDVASPESAEQIYNSISSEVKGIWCPDDGHHNLVFAEERLEAFRRIREFLDENV